MKEVKLTKEYLIEGEIIPANSTLHIVEAGEDWTQIRLDGMDWYLQKIDSTHFQMTTDPDGRYRPATYHVDQLDKSTDFYSAVRAWLKGSGNISGVTFDQM